MANHDARGLIPQSHGGALRPFGPGNGAAAARAPWRATRRAALDLIREAVPEAVATLVRNMHSPDERVATVAAEQILNRALGRPGYHPQGDSDTAEVLDLSHLSAGERQEIADALDTIARVTGRAIG